MRIETLEEFLSGLNQTDPMKKVWLNIQIKSKSEELIDKTYNLLVKYNRTTKTMWGMTDSTYEDYMYEKAPEIY